VPESVLASASALALASASALALASALAVALASASALTAGPAGAGAAPDRHATIPITPITPIETDALFLTP
jgi:hypothetical protein